MTWVMKKFITSVMIYDLGHLYPEAMESTTKNYWLKGLNYEPQKKTIESFENVENFQKIIPNVHMYLSNLVYAYLALNNF